MLSCSNILGTAEAILCRGAGGKLPLHNSTVKEVTVPKVQTVQVGIILVVQDPQPVPPLLADFRKLRSQMQQQGLFRCSKGYYIFKLASNFLLLGSAIAFFALWNDSLWAYILSACLISLFWQQSGWLAHDFLHHQVFRSRRTNDLMGLLIGSVCLVSTWFGLHPK